MSLVARLDAKERLFLEELQKEVLYVLEDLGISIKFRADDKRRCWKVAIIGPSQLGKTCLIEHVLVVFLPSRLDPSLAPWDTLEAVKKYDELKLGALGDGPKQCQMLQRPCMFKEGMLESERNLMLERIQDARDTLSWARAYKLAESTHGALGLFFPKGGQGTAGSNIPVVTSGSTSEFQVLLVFESRAAIVSQLIKHMDVVSGSLDSCVNTAEKDYLSVVWRLMTPPDTDLQEQLERYKANPDDYEPPLRETFMRLAGQAFAWRSRSSSPESTEKPDDLLLIEMLAAGDFLRICLPPGSDAGWDFSDDQATLLEELSQQDKEGAGPWRMLLEAKRSGSIAELQDCREALLILTQHLYLFTPSKLLRTLDIELIDSVGFGDPNPRRQVVQRKLEAEVDHMIVMLDRDITSSARDHLLTSPFIARLVDAHLHPDPSTPPPTLCFMAYREHAGFEPPRGYRGNAVTLQYMLQFGGDRHVSLEMQNKVIASVRKALVDLFRRYIAENLAESSSNQRLFESLPAQLEGAIPVFFSFPLLGLSIFHELEAARRGKTAKGASQPPQGEQHEQQHIGGAGALSGATLTEAQEASDVECDDNPTHRVTNCSVEDLRDALRYTQLDEFLASLLQEPYNRAVALSQLRADECAAAFAAINEQLSSVEMPQKGLSLLQEHLRIMNYKHQKNAATIRDLELKVGPGSFLAQQVHNRFETLNSDILRPLVARVLVGTREDIRTAALSVAKKLITKFKLEDSNQQRVTSLQRAVDPSSSWQDPNAPIATWLLNAFSSKVGFNDLKGELLGTVLKRIVEISKEIMVDTLMESASQNTTPQQRSDLRAVLNEKLPGWLNFESTVEQTFRTVFFKGRKANEPVTEYRRVLVEQLRRKLPQLSIKLQEVVQRQMRRTRGSGTDAGKLLADMLRTFFTHYLVDQLLAPDMVGEGLCFSLEETLGQKLLEVRHRLYDKGLPAVTEGRPHMRWATLFLKCYKQFKSLMDQEQGQTLGSSNAVQLRIAAAEIRKLQEQLCASVQPRQLASCLSPTMRRLLEPALERARTRAALRFGAIPQVLVARAAESRVHAPAASDADPSSAGVDGFDALLAAPVGSNWGNGVDGRGVTVTAEHMRALQEVLSGKGLKLIECPGRYNDCGYYAILSQTLGISLDASNAEALRAVEDYRQLVRSVLEQHLSHEQGQPEDQRQWTSAILALQGQPLGTPNEVREALRSHLDGVWPSHGRGDRTEAGAASGGRSGTGPITLVELAVIAGLLEGSHHSLHLYNPSYSAEKGYCTVLWEAQHASAVALCIANVPAGGAGELNHWNVVAPVAPAALQLQPRQQGSASERESGRRASLQASAASDLHPDSEGGAEGELQRGGKRQRTED